MIAMKKVIENIATAIFGCEIYDRLDLVSPRPWQCCSGYRDEWARVYTWTPDEGFVDITDSPLIPKHPLATNAMSGTKDVMVPSFYIKDLKLPKGNYLVLLQTDTGSWSYPEQYRYLLGRVLQIEE